MPAFAQRKPCGGGAQPAPRRAEEAPGRVQHGISELQRTVGNRAVRRALQGDGKPLEAPTRSLFEGRFGHDFGNVRVHVGTPAAESARDLTARAFTYGSDIVFGAGEYRPETDGGRGLIAHELAHVVQQSSTGPAIQRACLPDADCATPAGVPRVGSAADFGQQAETTIAPAQAAKRGQTAAVAQASGHGRRAVEVERLFARHLPKLQALVHAVVVDDTLPADVDAARVNCAAWAGDALPPTADQTPFAGATKSCIAIAPRFEKEAAHFNGLDPTTVKPQIMLELRQFIEFDILRLLTHEVTHERVIGETLTFPTGDAHCTDALVRREVSELASVISEYPIVSELPYDTFGKPWAEARLKDPRVEGKSTESIAGSIREIRCGCECSDADALIRRAFEIASAFWPEKKKNEFHVYMKRGKGSAYGVYWPYEGNRLGVVGPNEFAFTGGFGFSGDERLSVAMLTYRRVITSWANGRLRLTAGLSGNLASLWEPYSEYGALTGGVSFLQKPRAFESVWGGFTARAEIGGGYGNFALKSAEGSKGAADVILQIGGGIQFYIPRTLSMYPLSLEAAFRLAEPIDDDAKRIKMGTLSLVLPF
jgi:hypothetical protein